MGYVMKAADLAAKAVDIAKNYKTLYVMGCFGAPMNAKNKARYKNNNDYNRQPARQKMIDAATADTFGFDCVCLIKGILWGWCGDKNKTYGGATYLSNGVDDFSTESMISKYCTSSSTDFKNIEVGEVLWLKGHAGIYIGDGLAVECTPAWKNQVQITAVGNIGSKAGYNTRKWTKHGKLQYIDYAAPSPAPTPTPTPSGDGTTIKFVDLPTLTYDEKTKKITSKGYAVKLVQGIVGVTTDGDYGPNTKKAVTAFQAANKLTADGVVGRNTWACIAKLCKG